MPPRTRARRLLLAIAGAALAAPLAATEVYVPLLNPVANDGSRADTQVWVANAGSTTGTFRPVVLAENSDGTQRPTPPGATALPVGSSFQLTNLAQAGKYALLALDLATGVTADARIVTQAPGGTQTVTQVPVVSSANAAAAGAKVELLDLDRDPDSGKLADLGVVNVTRTAAQCQVTFFSSAGAAMAPPATVAVPPLGLRHFHDSLGLVGLGRVAAARAEVSCNQAFFPYAAIFRWPTSQYLFVTASVAGGASSTPSAPPPPPASGSSVIFTVPGLVHAATVSDPKGTVDVPVDKALSLRKMIIDWDVVPGPWNRDKIPGAHMLLWLYRGKYRSNTIANVNAFGPNKYTLKFNQNIDLPAGSNTSVEAGFTFLQGTRYHFHYIYDAEHQTASIELSSGGTVLRSMSARATANGNILTIPATGLICEFGNYFGQEGPEVASIGWNYYDLRIEMVPY